MKFIGVMTGNSLDAVDVVLTEFNDKSIKDICGYSLPIPQEISSKFIELKQKLILNNGDIEKIYKDSPQEFLILHDDYINLVAQTIKCLLTKNNINSSEIEAIGFHGQTCYHLPPSIAGDEKEPITIQVGSGQMLADITDIPVVFDFRSDDIMNGGEGAPLAPIHHVHISEFLREKDVFPVAFCNGGNTGNISIVSEDINSKELKVVGWDVGPFNHYVDYLARTELGIPCDVDGKVGKTGKVNYELMDKLFSSAVLTANGDNFLNLLPPKSSDPAWYKIIPELTDNSVPLADRIYTVECFSAEIFVKSLSQIPFNVERPKHFLLFGGGWNNQVIKKHFENVLRNKSSFLRYSSRKYNFVHIENAVIEFADALGYNSKYMEARIFADMAKCFVLKQPFSIPSVTGCKKPTKCGIMVKPNGNNKQLWSRAVKGWSLKQKISHL